MIYGGTRGYVFSINETNGKEMWRVKLSTGIIFNAASSGDVSVILMDNIIVAGCNGHVWGIDKITGEILWHNGMEGLGNGFVSLTNENISVQYIHKHTHS